MTETTVTAFEALSPDERTSLQRRTLLSLVTGVLPGGAALTAAVAANALLGEDLTGRASLGTLAAAFLTIGGTLATTPLASYMVRHGRRKGLRLGWAIGCLGALSAFLAAAFGIYPLLLIGALAMGGGQAANLSARYAAADLADDTNRAKAIGSLVWTSSISSAAAPSIALGFVASFAVLLGLNQYAGPYLMGIVLFGVAAFLIDRTLRPDPLEVVGGLADPNEDVPTGVAAFRAQFRRAGVGIRKIFALPAARLAMVSMLVGQAVMVGVMTATPLHMRSGSHEIRVIGFVISVHIIGMYFFSPLVGWLVDRFGPRPMIACGGGILFLGAEMASQTRAQDSLGVFVGLFFVGLGWSFGLISGSSLLTSAFSVAERVPIQGASDLVMSGSGAIAALSAGVVYEFGSYQVLSRYAGFAAVGMSAYAIWRMLRTRDPRPAAPAA